MQGEHEAPEATGAAAEENVGIASAQGEDRSNFQSIAPWRPPLSFGFAKATESTNFRDASFAEVIVGVDPDPANNDRMIAWARDYWSALHPHSAGGAYLNMVMDEGQDTIKAGYRDNYPRLAEIKARYDPTNLFRVNQNIKPAS